jgi:glutathione synthase
MVVQPKERNVFDQRLIEYGLFDKFGIKMMRRTLAQIEAQAKLGSHNELMIMYSYFERFI